MDINLYLLIFLIIIYILGAYQMLLVIDELHEKDNNLPEPYGLVDYIMILFWWVVIILQIIKRSENNIT